MTSERSLTASRAFTLACAAALLAFGAAAANAGEACETHASASASDVPAITVGYGDLNLATREGNRVLLRRIVTAAAKVCPAIPASGPRLTSRVSSCREEAIARAVSDTKNAQLVEMHAAARGRRMATS